jgi:hypothetical protein
VRWWAFGATALAVATAVAADRHPALVADLPDEVVSAIDDHGAGVPSEILERVLSLQKGFIFRAEGLAVRTDRRWYAGASVSGPGAPILELRRWPGDTVLAFYDLDSEAPAAPVPGLELVGKAATAGDWTIHEGTLATTKGPRRVVWGEARGHGRRLGALGVPGDAGFGPPAVPDLIVAIEVALRRTTLEEAPAAPAAVPVVPDLPAPPNGADESHDGWQTFQGPGFTLGLPPGLRAARLDLGVGPARPIADAAAWIRGRFRDRDEQDVVVGDARHAGYVAQIEAPDEAWRAGVAPPLGAPAADKRDEAALEDPVRAWTGASRATVSHWREEGFAGDWLVFRLLVNGRGIEIGLPVVSSWRSLALFWIPTTWRPDDKPPAPPPIDPAASLGVRFDRLSGEDRRRLPLTEGFLCVGDLRLEVPKGLWPVANLASSDGMPLTFVDPDGRTVGTLTRLAAGSDELSVQGRPGWSKVAHPKAQRASQIWKENGGAALLIARDGHGYLLQPTPSDGAFAAAWMRLWQSASFTRSPRRS